MPAETSAQRSSDARRGPGGYRATYVILALGIAAFALLQSLVIPVLTTIREAVGATQAGVTWMLTAYLLSAAVCTPIIGRLGDMVGRRRVLVASLTVLAAGCVLAALASSLPLLIVARVIQGAGGGVLPLSFGIVRDEFPDEKVPGVIGVLAGLGSAGAGVGVVLAGPMVDLLGVHWLFWLPAIVLGPAAVGAWFVVPESGGGAGSRINWWAAVLLTGWLVFLLLGVSRAPSWGWGSPRTLGMLAAAVVVAALWIAVEARSDNPLIDMGMMRIRGVWTTNLVALLVGLSVYASFAFLPAFLQTPASSGYGQGASVTESGFLLLPQTLASFVLGTSAGPLARRFGSKRLLLVGCLLSGIGYAALAVWHGSVGVIASVTILMGTGSGLVFAAMANLIVSSVRPDQTGVASGMNANIRTIGGSLGSAIVSSLVTAHAGPDGLPLERGYVVGFLLMSGAVLLAALAAAFVPAVGRVPASGREPRAELTHAELAMLPGGTVVGDEPE